MASLTACPERSEGTSDKDVGRQIPGPEGWVRTARALCRFLRFAQDRLSSPMLWHRLVVASRARAVRTQRQASYFWDTTLEARSQRQEKWFGLLFWLLASGFWLFLAVGCRRESTVGPVRNLNLANKVETRSVTLFFESPELVLVPETRTLVLPQQEAAALSAVLRELLKGSSNASVPRPLPQDSVLRASYLLPDGTAVVDVGGTTLANGWNTGSHSEMMAIYSIVQTLATNFSAVRRVRLIVNGQPAETLAGHIRIDRPLRPLPYLVRR